MTTPGNGRGQRVLLPRATPLIPQIEPRLAALPCDLVWATTWEEEANIELAPRFGLPQLPVENWPEPSAAHEREDQWFGLHRKT